MGPDKMRNMTNLIQEGLLGEIDMGRHFPHWYNPGDSVRSGCHWTLHPALPHGHLHPAGLPGPAAEHLRKINRVPLGCYNQVSFGDVLSRVTNDVDTIGQTMNQSLGNLVTACDHVLRLSAHDIPHQQRHGL